jgi:hypothetical protein
MPKSTRAAPWFKSSFTSSFLALLTGGHLPIEETVSLNERTDELRDSMVKLIESISNFQATRAAQRIRYATDLQSLWFLRTELMAVLAARYGEATARERLDALTEQFEDLLPKRLRSRATSLTRKSRN